MGEQDRVVQVDARVAGAPDVATNSVFSAQDPELQKMLNAPWEWLDHQAKGSEAVVNEALKHLEGLGAAEDRVRRDYKSRFAVELLQNANDACLSSRGRGKVWFEVTDTALLVGNQGVPFDRDRLGALIQLGASSKGEAHLQHRAIGYKGIGFNAVFDITDSPQVLSRTVQLAFDRGRLAAPIGAALGREPRTVPARYFPFELSVGDWEVDADAVRRMVRAGAVTVIRLPYRDGAVPSEVGASIIRSITPESLLFMPNIGSIELAGHGLDGAWHLKRGKEVGGGRLFTIVSPGGDESWVVSTGTAALPAATAKALDDEMWAEVRQLDVAVAIPWKGSAQKGRPEARQSSVPLHVYFPTDDRLDRSILVNGDFYVDQSRQHVAIAGAGLQVAELIAQKAADLVAALTKSFSGHGRALLEVLAPAGRSNGFGARISEVIDERLRETEFLRTHENPTFSLRPDQVVRLPSNLPMEHRPVLMAAVDDPIWFIRLEDDADEVSALLDRLGCKRIGCADLAGRLRPQDVNVSYDRWLQALEPVWDSATSWDRSTVIQVLRARPVLKDASGVWAAPDKLVRSLDRLPDAPPPIAQRVAKVPRTHEGQLVLEDLQVEDEDLGDALDRVCGNLELLENHQRETLTYVRAIWDANRSVFSDRELGKLPVPVRQANGRGRTWAPASDVYFTERWTAEPLLEVLYGPFGTAEFLAEVPAKGRGKRADDLAFFRQLGIAAEPRVLASRASLGGMAYNDPRQRWCKLVKGRSDPCGGHRNSDREIVDAAVDRLADLLASTDHSSRLALAQWLARQKEPYGGDAVIRCKNRTHDGDKKHGKTARGYQSWLLATSAWLPAPGGVDGARFVRPSAAWYDLPSSLDLCLPEVRGRSHDACVALRLVSGSSPSVAGIESALAVLASGCPDLSAADERVCRTVDWLMQRLETALRNDRGQKPSGDKRDALRLPAWQGGSRTWTNEPVVLDVEGADQLPGLALIGTSGDCTNIAAAYDLSRASDLIESEVRATGVARVVDGQFHRDRRLALFARLRHHTNDQRRLARRIKSVEELVVGSLEVVHRLVDNDAAEVGLTVESYCEQRPSRKRVDSIVFYRLADHRPDRSMAKRLAEALGEPEQLDAVQLFLVFDDPSSGFELTKDDLRIAEAEFAEWSEPDLAEEAAPTADTDSPIPEREDRAEAADAETAGAEPAESRDSARADGANGAESSTRSPGTAAPIRPEGVGSGSPSANDAGESQSLSENQLGAGPSPAAQADRCGPSPTFDHGQERSASGSGSSSDLAEGRRPVAEGEARGSRSESAASGRPGAPLERFYSYVHEKDDDDSSNPERAADRVELGRSGVQAAIDWEAQRGRQATEMSHANPGYDVVSTDDTGEVLRYIEVKALAGPWGTRGVTLSRTQFQFSWDDRTADSSWLYVVEYAASDTPVVHAIHHPARRVSSFVFDAGWRVGADREASSTGGFDEDDLIDPRVRVLIDGLDGALVASPEIGLELDTPERWQVEAQWPEKRVAIVIERDAARDRWLEENGWRSRHVDEWTVSDLTVVLASEDVRVDG